MQGLPREVEKMAAKWLIYGLRGCRNPPQVEGIADDRVSYAGEVHSDLMRPPGGQTAFEQREAGLPGTHRPVAGQRELAAPGYHRHPLAVAWVAANGAL